MTDEEKEMTVKEYHDKHGNSFIVGSGGYGLNIRWTDKDKNAELSIVMGSGLSMFYANPLRKIKNVLEFYKNNKYSCSYGCNMDDCDTNITT